MTGAYGFLRDRDRCRRALEEMAVLLSQIRQRGLACANPRLLGRAVQDRGLVLTATAFLEALLDYIDSGGGSRGGFLILNPQGSRSLSLPDGQALVYRSENPDLRGYILTQQYDSETAAFRAGSDPVRPLPEDDSWFETVWSELRARAD
jgi:hypothetical protein